MKPTDFLQLLGDAYREKAAFFRRHIAVSRIVGQYDFNNTYQYVIAREEQHLGWLRDALVAAAADVPPEEPVETLSPVKGDAAVRGLIADDAGRLEAAVAAWRERIKPVTNARHKLMLELMLGEMLEHARLFRQAAGGDLDVLGKRTGGERTAGSVLSTRWVE